MSTGGEILRFLPFSSCINPSFWFELSRAKLDEYKLNDDYKTIYGFYNNFTNNDLPAIMNFDYSSFNIDKNEKEQNDCGGSGGGGGGNKQSRTTIVSGNIKIFNTINEFNLADKNKILADFTQKLWLDIKDGKVLENPQLLNQFLLIAFANLKNYVFHYWFAFPAITFQNKHFHLIKQTKYDDFFNKDQAESFVNNLCQFQDTQSRSALSFFSIDFETLNVKTVKEGVQALASNKRTLFAFYDPNSINEYPSWPLRNLLTLLSYHCNKLTNGVNTVEVIALRERYKNGIRSLSNSIVFAVQLISITHDEAINTIGWEKNEKQQLTPRVVDMSQSMNSEKLAESSVSLNLKLMKWRIMPNINLDSIKQTKCLLLGSGTLGCNIARALLAWGVENITFVDNSKISYSNPVRQSLFNFDDSIGSNKDNHKAIIAAENLKKIYPGVNANGVVLSIPMPGHYVSEAIIKRVEEETEKLENLIKSHDCIFLLMDTRESRWLPTMLAAANRKLVINSALGFDSFLVMRHGVKCDSTNTSTSTSTTSTIINNKVPGSLLGCYFCNDIVAPGNSTVDRTLDQQCTVSRPGLSMIASALAVELMVSCLQHPLKYFAPADTNSLDADVDSDAGESSCLGIIPHQIRGYLHTYSVILPASQAFDKCTACSNQVIDLYKKDGFQFLLKAFNDSSYLEEVTGLKQLKNALDENEPEFVLEISDSDD